MANPSIGEEKRCSLFALSSGETCRVRKRLIALRPISSLREVRASRGAPTVAS